MDLNYTNLYSLNKTSEIENGLSAILGFDFKKNIKNKNGVDQEKLSLSIGQVFSNEVKEDIPSKSSSWSDGSDLKGVVVTEISSGGVAEQAGFELGDLINRVGQKKISNINEFINEIEQYEEDKKILVLVKRGRASRFLTLRR